jgi:hypothetical protein
MSNNNIKPIKLTTLDPRFYRLWASQAETIFRVHDLLNLVQGHETHPHPVTQSDDAEEATAAMNALTNAQRKEVIEYQRRHNLALSTIIKAMEDTSKLDIDLTAMKIDEPSIESKQ